MNELDSLVPVVSCWNSKPLEEYFGLATQLRLKAKTMQAAGEDLEAYIALRQFRDLAASMQRHNGYNLAQYRGLKYSLNQELSACEKQLASLSASIMQAQRPPTAPSAKTIVLPTDLVPGFTRAARNNTAHDVETLGVLAGRPRSSAYEVEAVIIPPQRGTSDSCECSDDPVLFAAMEQGGWMALGWIHTHPGHGLFLSSVDLHTQALYQQQLPEAIAIVVSQREGTGVFRLSTAGLREVCSCEARGFHHHAANLYLPVSTREGGKVRVLDLRP